jgi:MFS family permease
MNKYLYLTGTVTSAFGDGIQAIAIIWYIYSLNHNHILVGAIIAISYVPSFIMAPFLGVLSDRIDPKKTTVICDLCRFGVILGIFIILFISKIPSLIIIALFIGQLISSSFYTLFKSSSQKLIRCSFAINEVYSIISISSSLSLVLTIIGSGLAGYLLTITTPAICFLINSLTFLVAAFCFNRLETISLHDVENLSISQQSATSFYHEIIAGIRYILGKKEVLVVFVLSIPSSGILQGINTLMAPYAKETINSGPRMFALLDISCSIGGFFAGILLQNFKWIRKVSLNIGLLGIAMSALLTGLFNYIITSVIGFFLLGLFTMIHIVSTQSSVNLLTNEQFLGRVVNTRTVVVSLAKIFFSLLSGYLMVIMTPKNVFLLFSILSFLFFILSKTWCRDLVFSTDPKTTTI